MKKKIKIVTFVVLLLGVVLTAGLFLSRHNVAVLNPKGVVGHKERSLMIIAALLAVLVIVPVFTMTAVIAWKYRAGNTKAKYMPNWDHHRGMEFTWWAIPSAIILVLAVLTWTSSHSLDPYRPLTSNQTPVQIQVVALDWKWLFIYPEQHVATVNYFKMPVNTPVEFTITADAPMNSFWIPQLGGQIYAMPGMSTELHLEASTTGNYNGSSANISGKGFAGMKFVATATSQSDFEHWLQTTQRTSQHLDTAEYNGLAKPSENNKAATYSNADPELYDTIMMKYMMPMQQSLSDSAGQASASIGTHNHTEAQ
jgi:cytochrome o ubiquinol oxidase subunit 2